jgi:serine/threonine protein kinase
LLKKLGKGSFASVYAVERRRPDDASSLAVKVIDVRKEKGGHASFAGPVHQKRLDQTVREVQIMYEVTGEPCIVGLLEAFTEGCLVYMIIERCAWTLLHALERMPSLTEGSLVGVFSQMLRGIAVCHAHRVVHRDVKPDNFLCSADNTVKLCDFGLSTIIENNEALKGVYGTAPFMAPEMLNGKGYDTKIDIWSIGVIVYVLLFGKFPYNGLEATGAAMKAAIVSGDPGPDFQPRQSLKAAPDIISPVATAFVEQLLCRRVSRRPSAKAAMTDSFFVDPSPRPEPGESLRRMLHAAIRSGAFSPFRPKEEVSDLDMYLTAMQQGSSPHLPCGEGKLPSAVKEARDECDISTNLASTGNASTGT